MKNISKILAFGFLCFITGRTYGQLFNYTWQDEEDSEKEIVIFTGFRSSGDSVESIIRREPGTHPAGVTVSPYGLHFIGDDFKTTGNYREFDLTNGKYVFVPFNPHYPVLEITQADSMNKVKVFPDSDFDNWNEANALSNGHKWWYFCSCHMSLSGPGGCVSTLANGVTGCANEEGCEEGCQGFILYVDLGIVKGGGIFIKVEEAYHVVDDF